MFIAKSIVIGLLICVLFFFFFVSRFNDKYELQPLLTLGLLNASLTALSDLLAQALDSYKLLKFRNKRDVSLEKYGNTILLPASTSKLDVHRTIRYAAYGLCLTPIQFRWFVALSNVIQTENPFIAIVLRVALDQFIFAPLGIVFFFLFMGITECKSYERLKSYFRKHYWPTLKANYILWPAVQLFNFTFVPLVLQVIFANAVSMVWTAYLSLKNSSPNADV
ncbi:Integral membrane protein [Schizosaccharomyces pombe]|uniref:Uncharacterized protein C4G9.14 n=1 Tax=Schizosaccharomyces pombe (strain 972 / ATCC 24843) TaxID=284812 RepID=YD1E_SCHPO|nr:putative PMP22 family protein 2 [Schizosaccharomyces pombe]Q10244.1 RecName: Full=Uncharacterized protein C4G9.14 [Schizosaccharomyces pombe 972h-]CAA93564.1 mitochondrial Mpv17/PMP22 family protein 2 (predicted) [Schizosaccharomyces pombe]|eukprot:NP_593696.1 putative PMP22 family protein 2 [Schizosaccharomyces pombe]